MQKFSSFFSARSLARGALITALYTALCLLLQPISYSYMQFRLSEALCVLPVFWPEAIPALAIGCFLSNLFGASSALDLVLGPLATLLAAYLTRRFRRLLPLALAMPVFWNALVVGWIYHWSAKLPFLLTFACVGIGEAAVLYTAGLLLYAAMRKLPASYLQK